MDVNRVVLMSEWRRIAENLGISVPPWKAHACDYCESIGLRFCVNFGTDNAVDIARAHWTNRRKVKQ